MFNNTNTNDNDNYDDDDDDNYDDDSDSSHINSRVEFDGGFEDEFEDEFDDDDDAGAAAAGAVGHHPDDDDDDIITEFEFEDEFDVDDDNDDSENDDAAAAADVEHGENKKRRQPPPNLLLREDGEENSLSSAHHYHHDNCGDNCGGGRALIARGDDCYDYHDGFAAAAAADAAADDDPGPDSSTSPTTTTTRTTTRIKQSSSRRHQKARSQRKGRSKERRRRRRQRRRCGWSKNCWKYVFAFVGLAMIVLFISARIITTAIYNKNNNNNTAAAAAADDDENKNNTLASTTTTTTSAAAAAEAETATTDSNDEGGGVLNIPVTSWKQPQPDQQDEQEDDLLPSPTTTSSTATLIEECPGSIMDHPEYETSSSYFEHLAAFSGNGGNGNNVHLSYSFSFGESSGSSSSSSNTIINNSSWIDVDNCRLNCHGVELRVSLSLSVPPPPTSSRKRRRKRQRRRERRKLSPLYWEATDQEETQSDYYRSLFRVTNGGYLQNCIIKFIEFKDSDVSTEPELDDTTDATNTTMLFAGVTCDRNDCTIQNVQCYSTTDATTDDDVRNTTTSATSSSTLTTASTNTCILIDTQTATSLNPNSSSSWVSGFETNVSPKKTQVRIVGGHCSTTPVLDHGIIVRLPATTTSSSSSPPVVASQDILVSVEDFVVDRVSNSGIKVVTSAISSSASPSVVTTTTSSSNNNINLRFVNVTSSNNGGDGLELNLSVDSAEDVNLMVEGGLYRNNVGNGVHIVHGSLSGSDDGESTTASSSSSSKTSRIVVTDSTSISHNGMNGIRIKNAVATKLWSEIDDNEQSTSGFYYVFDSVSLHDNAWFGIVMLDGNGGDDNGDGIDSSIDNSGGRETIDILVRNTYVTRNGHDGMLIVQHNTSVTIEQSSFNQNGYFNRTDDDDDKTKTTTDTPPSSTEAAAASSSSFSRSSPYGSGAAIYEPYSVVVSRSEFMDNLQNGLSIMDLQLQRMINVTDDPSGGNDGSASTTATRIAAVQLSYLKLFHNDRDGLVIIDSDNDDDSGPDHESSITVAPHVEIDNLIMCSNKRNGMTLFHLKSLEINDGVVSCRNLDGNGGWDYQLGGIDVEDIFSTTASFATPRIVGDTCTNGLVGESSIGTSNFCRNEYLAPCQDDSCDRSSSTTNNDAAYPTIGASSSSSSSQPSLGDESSINV